MIRMSEGTFSAMQGKKPPKARPEYTRHIAKRADKNQPEIVKYLRTLGFQVHILHEVGRGLFDLLVSKHGMNILVEIKDGLKPPSARELTPQQKRFHFAWAGMRCVVTCRRDCDSLNKQINIIAGVIREAGVTLHVTGSQESMYEPKLY